MTGSVVAWRLAAASTHNPMTTIATMTSGR